MCFENFGFIDKCPDLIRDTVFDISGNFLFESRVATCQISFGRIDFINLKILQTDDLYDPFLFFCLLLGFLGKIFLIIGVIG